jgi:UDP-2,3-diacylglucosamine pyrophosphatase LpxH
MKTTLTLTRQVHTHRQHNEDHDTAAAMPLPSFYNKEKTTLIKRQQDGRKKARGG